MHYRENELDSIYPVFEPSNEIGILKVPINVKKQTYYIPISFVVNFNDANSRKIFEYGKSLINRVQQEFIKLSEIDKRNILSGNASINLGRIIYNSQTGEIQ